MYLGIRVLGFRSYSESAEDCAHSYTALISRITSCTPPSKTKNEIAGGAELYNALRKRSNVLVMFERT